MWTGAIARERLGAEPVRDSDRLMADQLIVRGARGGHCCPSSVTLWSARGRRDE